LKKVKIKYLFSIKSKEELFNYINSSDDFQDLTRHFGELYKQSPEVYEIIILMYQEFQTREKINKDNFFRICRQVSL